MKQRHKNFIKLNIVSLFFIIVSFIYGTLAWFAYSGLSDTKAKIDIQAWNIDLSNSKGKVGKEVVIKLTDISPGMTTMTENISIKNFGDSNAEIKYEIVSARILEKEYTNDIKALSNSERVQRSLEIEDILAHTYPFHINLGLDKQTVKAIKEETKADEANFELSVSWPFDANNNEEDSKWGNNAYQFKVEETAFNQKDSSYSVRTAIEIIIKLSAEQSTGKYPAKDERFYAGKQFLIDISTGERCSTVGGNCIETYVLEHSSTYSNGLTGEEALGDDKITLIPYLGLDPTTVSTTIEKRPLKMEDITNIISNDTKNSFYQETGYDEIALGNLRYKDPLNTLNRFDIFKAKLDTNSAIVKFDKVKYPFLQTTRDICLEKNEGEIQYVLANDQTNGIIKATSTSCVAVPVFIIPKERLFQIIPN